MAAIAVIHDGREGGPKYEALLVGLERAVGKPWVDKQAGDREHRISHNAPWLHFVRRAVKEAPAVVLVWSKSARDNFRRWQAYWNKDEGLPEGQLVWEARYAAKANKLYVVRIDNAPMRKDTDGPAWLFHRQFSYLADFDGNRRHVAFDTFIDDLKAFCSLAELSKPKTRAGVDDLNVAAWIEINHSRSQIEWHDVRIDKDCQFLQQVMKLLLPDDWQRWTRFSWLDEGSGTRNFCAIGADNQKRLLRLHVSDRDKRDIERVQKIARWVNEQPLFDPEFARCIVPCSDAPDTVEVGWPFDNEPYRGSKEIIKFAELYPFCERVEHFDGSEEQMLSFAKLFGRLQSQLKLLDSAPFKDWPDETESVAFSGDAEALKLDYRTIDDVFDFRRRYDVQEPLDLLWQTHRAMVLAQLEEICGFVNEAAAREGSRMPLLADCHPHNSFFIGQDCRLIYDYHRVGRYFHSEVVAFAAHRFAREIVRRKKSLAVGRPERARQFAREFIEAYSLTGPPVEPNLLDELPFWIQLVALRKLRSILAHITGIRPDVNSRGQAELFSEARKFLSFLLESRAFA